MPNKETLSFKIELSAKFWNKMPEFSILINDELTHRAAIDSSGSSVISFEHEVNDGLNTIAIRLENKESSDTVVDNGTIVNDMLLNIDEISIEGVSLGHIVRNGVYYLDQEQQYQGNMITQLESCVNLGWNGTYRLNFSSPFYMWLLENL